MLSFGFIFRKEQRLRELGFEPRRPIKHSHVAGYATAPPANTSISTLRLMPPTKKAAGGWQVLPSSPSRISPVGCQENDGPVLLQPPKRLLTDQFRSGLHIGSACRLRLGFYPTVNKVRVAGFEPTPPCSQGTCSSQAELHPEWNARLWTGRIHKAPQVRCLQKPHNLISASIPCSSRGGNGTTASAWCTLLCLHYYAHFMILEAKYSSRSCSDSTSLNKERSPALPALK